MKLPKVKTENIVTRNLKDEILIYDFSTDKAFCLNETAAKVFEACDGKTTLTELKDKYQLTDDIIFFALDELKKENLIGENYVSPYAGLSRREVVRRVGLTSMTALPVIASLIVPRAANAASCNPSRPGCTAPRGSFSDVSKAYDFDICSRYCQDQAQTTCCSCRGRVSTFAIDNTCLCACSN